MSFSSMPQPKGLLVTSSALQNIYNSLNTSNVTNNTNLTPADAGFVGFTGVRANANSFQVVDSRGNTAFISGQQAANLGIVNSSGLDFTGVQRFLPQNISFATTPAPVASGTPTPGQTTVPSNTSNPTTGRSLAQTASDAINQIKGTLGTTGILVGIGLLAFVVLKK